MTGWAALRAYVCHNTGWTWDEVGRLTIPRLRALRAEWRQRPPVHWLVANYLGYEPPADTEPETAGAVNESTPTTTPPPWLGGGRGVHASDALRSAQTPEEALAAAEQLFFGEVHTYGRR